MKNLFRLAAVMLKGNGVATFGGDTNRRKRKLSTVASVLLFGFLAIYMTGIVTATAFALYHMLAPVGLQGMLVSLILSASVILTFVFGILYVISVFYHSSDIEKILALPLRGDQIIGAKLIVTMVYEYLFLVVLMTPPLTIYGILEGRGPVYFLFMIFSILAVPAIPLALAAILVMLIMRFTPFARNKDRFSMVASILALLMALGLSFGLQRLATFDSQDLVKMIQAGATQIARLTSSVFPGTAFAAVGLVETHFLPALANIGLLLLVAAAALALTLFVGRVFYFKGVIGLGSAAAARRALTGQEMDRIGRGGSPFWTYVLKDFLILIRTPIFFLNNVLMNFLWPLFVIFPILANQGGNQGAGIRQLILSLKDEIFQGDMTGAALALAIGFGVACFVTGTNGVAESALSREGKLFYFMKILPMSYTRQVWAKLAVGILLSLSGSLILVILFAVFLQPPFWFILLLLLMLPGAALLPNLTGIIFELYWPKLNWDNEAKAVKQNLNVIYGILLALFLAALAIVPVIAFQLSIWPAALIICLVPLALAGGLAGVIRRIAARRILALDA